MNDMQDFEKVESIMRYLYYSCYHWEMNCDKRKIIC